MRRTLPLLILVAACNRPAAPPAAPPDVDAQLLRASDALADDDRELAASVAESVLAGPATDAQRARAHWVLGMTRDGRAAVRDYTEAIRLDPADPSYRTGRAHARGQIAKSLPPADAAGEWRGVIADFRAAEARKPLGDYDLLLLAEAHLAIGEPGEAERALSALVRLKPSWRGEARRLMPGRF